MKYSTSFCHFGKVSEPEKVCMYILEIIVMISIRKSNFGFGYETRTPAIL